VACKRRPFIRTYAVPASPAYVEISLPITTAAFLLRPRTAVGLTIAIAGSPAEYFSLGAAETYTDEDLALQDPLVLRVAGASAATLEVWSWEG